MPNMPNPIGTAPDPDGASDSDQPPRTFAPTGDIAAIKREVARMIARTAEQMARNPPSTDNDLYDENGL